MDLRGTNAKAVKFGGLERDRRGEWNGVSTKRDKKGRH